LAVLVYDIRNMSQQGQEDGYYPRLNGQMIESGKFNGLIVSVVGIVQSHNGSSATIQCADKRTATIVVDPEASLALGVPLEVVGFLPPDGPVVEHFINRKLGDEFDLDVYNQMIAVQHNPKFSAYFRPPM